MVRSYLIINTEASFDKGDRVCFTIKDENCKKELEKDIFLKILNKVFISSGTFLLTVEIDGYQYGGTWDSYTMDGNLHLLT